jgi:hypothetical protein
MTDFDIQQMYNEMPFRKKVSLFLHQNHFLFWKITLMDVIIVVPLFVLIGYTLDSCTPLEFGYTVLIAAGICGIIEFFRIKLRRVKTYQLLTDQVATVRQLLDRYAEAVERSGTEEDKEQLSERLAEVEELNRLVEVMADVVYKEDVLGFSDEEKQES